ncbi:hypothetical protein GVAV_001715 [Gurleya vavrai]
MNFCYYKILLIVFKTNIFYFVKASDCCFLDYDTNAKTVNEPFLFTYSSSEFDAKKIEAHFFQIYYFLALPRTIENFKKVMVTVEPNNECGINDAFLELNKSKFVAYIKDFIEKTRSYTLKVCENTIFIECSKNYTFKVNKIFNAENEINEKIELALEKHFEVPVSGINKNNILKIFRNCQFEPPLNGNEKFTDTHIFFIDENVYEEDLNFLYDSILRLKALTSQKQTFPSFNVSLLSRCEMFENEIKFIDEKTALAENQENSKLFEKIYEIYIISPFYIYQKQVLSESTRIDKFKKIENNVEEIEKNI